MFRRTGQAQNAQLADLHAWPQGDRQVSNIGQFERDVATEARINETRGRVRQQAQPAQR